MFVYGPPPRAPANDRPCFPSLFSECWRALAKLAAWAFFFSAIINHNRDNLSFVCLVVGWQFAVWGDLLQPPPAREPTLHRALRQMAPYGAGCRPCRLGRGAGARRKKGLVLPRGAQGMTDDRREERAHHTRARQRDSPAPRPHRAGRPARGETQRGERRGRGERAVSLRSRRSGQHATLSQPPRHARARAARRRSPPRACRTRRGARAALRAVRRSEGREGVASERSRCDNSLTARWTVATAGDGIARSSPRRGTLRTPRTRPGRTPRTPHTPPVP